MWEGDLRFYQETIRRTRNFCTFNTILAYEAASVSSVGIIVAARSIALLSKRYNPPQFFWKEVQRSAKMGISVLMELPRIYQ